MNWNLFWPMAAIGFLVWCGGVGLAMTIALGYFRLQQAQRDSKGGWQGRLDVARSLFGAATLFALTGLVALFHRSVFDWWKTGETACVLALIVSIYLAMSGQGAGRRLLLIAQALLLAGAVVSLLWASWLIRQPFGR